MYWTPPQHFREPLHRPSEDGGLSTVVGCAGWGLCTFC